MGHGGVVSDRYDLQPSHREAFDGRLHHREVFVHPQSERLDRFLFSVLILLFSLEPFAQMVDVHFGNQVDSVSYPKYKSFADVRN